MSETLDHEAPEEVHELTEKQKRFVAEYLVDLNGTAAAIRAGYSPRTARQIAYELLNLPTYTYVQAAVEAAKAERSIRTEVTQDYVVRNLTEVVERCMQRAPVMVKEGKEWVQATDEEGRDIWQFDQKGANTALTTLARHLGMLTDKQQVTGADGGPVDVKVTHEVVDPSAG